LALLGASLSTGSDLDVSSVYMSALKDKLDESLDLFADVILNPIFPEKEFQRLQKQQIARIKREKARPFTMALRVFPKLLYGPDHAYGNPFTGSGYEETVKKITVKDLKKFHKTWFKPNNATLIVVGATTLAEVKPKLEKLFGKWKSGDVPTKNLAKVDLKPRPEVYLIDKPGAIQSVILAGHVAPPKSNPEEIAIEMLNTVLGGQFTSRVNMNLREDKHWSYGARTILVDARGQRPFFAMAPVQTDKTKESMIEIEKELTDIIGPRPVTREELEKVKKNIVLKLPGNWETNNSVLNSLEEIVVYNLPDDYYDIYPQKVKSVSLQEVRNVASRLIHPKSLVWVIVGDRQKIEAGIRELNFGEIQYIDADGNPVQVTPTQ